MGGVRLVVDGVWAKGTMVMRQLPIKNFKTKIERVNLLSQVDLPIARGLKWMVLSLFELWVVSDCL